ncbi:odorant receptor 131-2-like [Engraulis encrasicolus]|uniref:odorant receptor 131-2-like n=1 Tax=Engraulis encrasicolus TaxID=184585 RepID=UPI002FD2FC77
MSENSSEQKILKGNDLVRLNITTALVQVLVWPFIYINLFMYYTYRKKPALWAEPRFSFFSQMLLADSALFLMTDFAVITIHVHLLMPLAFCVPFVAVMHGLTHVSPTFITAMCLERYVAVCFPLHHVSVFTPARTTGVLVVVWLLSALRPFVDLCIMLSTVPRSYLNGWNFCYYEIILVTKWHMQLRGNLFILNYLALIAILLCCYGAIIRVARRASGDDKKAAAKGQRTLLLHLLQLVLATLEVICPYYEAQIMRTADLNTYIIVRYFNFLAFVILSRAIIPLIYGLRDEKFLVAMKSVAAGWKGSKVHAGR